MSFIDSVKDKLKQDPPPLENAIELIGKDIRNDVMKGNYGEAKNILEENLTKLQNGDFEAAVTDDDGKYKGYEKSWPPPEEEAQQLTNFVYLELLELVLEDLETIEGQLEPPITARDVVKGEKITLRDGFEGEINDLEEFLGGYSSEDVQGMSKDKFKRFRRKGYEKAKRIRIALGTRSAKGANDAVENEKYRKSRPRKQERYKENMGALITVKMAERHLDFIQELAKWEHDKYGLDMDQKESEELQEVKGWLKERYDIIKKLDDIIHPFVLDSGAEAGITKDEAFKNPQESLQRLSNADEVLEQLHEVEQKEDDKIKKLEQMIPA